ncbi:hypothetical protein HMPREF0083_00487 [Aneurinibacillus aneurinilyticus ATCC 12856]|uniref:Uncharacterized protein n=1 Tax=Aneurinibacillus aneurinilyticus ATCC 12856 TaxID=649747 RepID=U1WS21_ANEAE|nr:hypothetical protein HMPREF0083_00487 [Aneurinibacillus aneurinilyticus ATCC 12856]
MCYRKRLSSRFLTFTYAHVFPPIAICPSLGELSLILPSCFLNK